MSWIFSAVLLLIFLAYMTGYFWGKKKATQELTFIVEKDIEQDNLITVLHTAEENVYNSVPESLVESMCVVQSEIIKKEVIQEKNDLINISSEIKADSGTQEDLPELKNYYAQLIGFGTQKAAEKFVHRLQENKLPVKMKKRKSSTAKGKSLFWYQAVTEVFKDKDELERLVEKIAKKERLSGVTIVSC